MKYEGRRTKGNGKSRNFQMGIGSRIQGFEGAEGGESSVAKQSQFVASHWRARCYCRHRRKWGRWAHRGENVERRIVQNPKSTWRQAVARTIAQWETRRLGADCPHCVSAVRTSTIPASARRFDDRRRSWHTVCSVPKRKALEHGRTTVRRKSRRPTCGRGR